MLSHPTAPLTFAAGLLVAASIASAKHHICSWQPYQPSPDKSPIVDGWQPFCTADLDLGTHQYRCPYTKENPDRPMVADWGVLARDTLELGMYCTYGRGCGTAVTNELFPHIFGDTSNSLRRTRLRRHRQLGRVQLSWKAVAGVLPQKREVLRPWRQG